MPAASEINFYRIENIFVILIKKYAGHVNRICFTVAYGIYGYLEGDIQRLFIIKEPVLFILCKKTYAAAKNNRQCYECFHSIRIDLLKALYG